MDFSGSRLSAKKPGDSRPKAQVFPVLFHLPARLSQTGLDLSREMFLFVRRLVAFPDTGTAVPKLPPLAIEDLRNRILVVFNFFTPSDALRALHGQFGACLKFVERSVFWLGLALTLTLSRPPPPRLWRILEESERDGGRGAFLGIFRDRVALPPCP